MYHDYYNPVREGKPTPADLFGRSLVARPDLRRYVSHLRLRGDPDKVLRLLSVQSQHLVLGLAHEAKSVELDMGVFAPGALSKVGDPAVDDAPFFANTDARRSLSRFTKKILAGTTKSWTCRTFPPAASGPASGT